MRTVETTWRQFGAYPLEIGRMQENDVSRVVVDVAECLRKYPNATFGINVTSPDGVSYPAEDVITKSGLVVWNITDGDVALHGSGTAQVVMYGENGEIARSAEARTVVRHSIVPDGDPPGAPYNWMDEMQQIRQHLEKQANPPFIVRTTSSSTVDKTYAEIEAARDAKRPIFLVDEFQAYTLANITSTGYIFSHYHTNETANKTGIWETRKILSVDGVLTQEASYPVKTPNPYKLTFTGAVSGTYDGSEKLTVNIPAGGGNGGEGGGVTAETITNALGYTPAQPSKYAQPEWGVETLEPVELYNGSFAKTDLFDGANMGIPAYWLIPAIELVHGQRYTIAWDGVSYDCDAMHSTKMGMTGAGNIGAVVDGAPVTGEPFVIVNNEATGVYTTIVPLVAVDDVTTLVVQRKDNVIHQIPAAYIGTNDIVVTISEAANGQLTARTNVQFETAYAMDADELAKAIRVVFNASEPVETSVSVSKREMYGGAYPAIFISAIVTGFDTMDILHVQTSYSILWTSNGLEAKSWRNITDNPESLGYYNFSEPRYLSARNSTSGSGWVLVDAATMRDDVLKFLPENAGKLLYIDEGGKAKLLTLGEGLTIVDGVLTISAAARKAVAGMVNVGETNVGEGL